jgi:vanillate/3-O-methylgallate O-demethylase
VTFAWSPDDVIKVWRSMLEQGEPYKYIDLPLSNYTSASYDAVTRNGKTVGVNMFSGYSYNERSMLSLGIVDADIPLGTEVKLVWGEENGGTQKPTVERHKQTEIRAIVSPAPYAKQAQTTYHEGWRSKATA